MIAVCIKSIDDRSTHGLSAADEGAIEMALRHGEAAGHSVIAVTVGGPAADRSLRVALACGVKTAIRVDAPNDMQSAAVAAALAPVVTHTAAVWCGDYSADRGTGSVPAFLAAQLRRQQALGLVGAEFVQPLRVIRRLDWLRTRRFGRCGQSAAAGFFLRSLGATGAGQHCAEYQQGNRGTMTTAPRPLPP